MSRPWRRALIWGGVPVLAIAAFLLVFSWSWFIPLVESRASAALGRPVTVGGLHVRLGRHTEITLDDVRIPNPEGFAPDPPLAQVPRLVVQVDIGAYWREWRIVVPWIRLERPHVEAIALQDGRNNYSFAFPEPAGEGAADADTGPRIGLVEVQEGTGHVAHAPLRADFRLTLETRQEEGKEATVVAEARGTYARQPLTAQLTGGALLSLRDETTPWPVDLRIANGPTRARLHGTLRNPLAFAGADLRLEFAGPNMELLTPLTGVPIPKTPAYRLTGRIYYAEGRVRFTDMDGRVGNSDLSGTIAVDPRGAKPDIVADLRSRAVDLADLTGFIGGEPGRDRPTRRTNDDRVLPNEPISFPKLEMANVHLTYHAGQIRGRSTPLDNLTAKLELVDGAVTLQPLSFGIGRGELSIAMTLMPQQNNALRANGQVDFRNIDIRRLMQAAGAEGGGGITGRARIDGVGRSTAEILAHANGGLTLLTSGGNLSAVLVDLSGLRLGQAIFSALGVPSRTQLECLVADYTIQNGVMTSRATLLETSDALMSAVGTIRLDQERLDLRVRSESKHFTVGALPTALLVTGTFKNPSVMPEVVELGIRGGIAAGLGAVAGPLAILPTIELGIGDDPLCRTLLERGRAAQRQAQDRERRR